MVDNEEMKHIFASSKNPFESTLFLQANSGTQLEISDDKFTPHP
jgi:hypothetical protein